MWSIGSLVIAGAVGLPIAVVLFALISPSAEAWAHLRQTVLADYVLNTTLLMLQVAVLAGVMGVALAWLTATKSFPGQRVFSWALVLPLAAPAYVVAYVYTDLLEFAGPVQSWLRELTGWQIGEYTFPAVRSLPGAGLVLSFVLYPYVYLLARASFASQAGAVAEAARVLGASRRRAFYRVALPSARPAIAGGLALALMETAADYGVVDYFGVSTFTTGIFRTWFALGDRGAALELAAWLFLVVAALVLAEYFARRGRVANPVGRNVSAPLEQLVGAKGVLATLSCLVPLVIGLVIPLAVLVRYAVTVGDPMLGRGFGSFLGASAGVAGAAAVVAVVLALWLVYAERLSATPATRLGIRTATLGYALPGAMLGVGILVPLTTLDKLLATFARDVLDVQLGLLLTGTAGALVFAYVARFLTVAFNACHGGMEKIHAQLDAVGRSLGARPGRLLREVHLPLMRPAALSALLLVFIDVMKELPATLILRPFNFETLATRVYRLASDERLAEASTAALTLVLLGIVPALLLGFQGRKARW